MYYPQWLFLIPLAVVIAALHLTYKYGAGWDTIIFQITTAIMAVLVYAQWIISNLWYQAWWLKSDKPREQPEPQPEPRRTLIDMNTGNAVYQNDTTKLDIDLETARMKRFSRTLINQREQEFKVDLREKTWEGQFGGRKNYVHVRDVRMAGAFAKENPELDNSRFVVAGEAGWRVVEAAANGRM